MALLDSLGAVPSSERTLRAWDLPKEQNYFPLLPKILGEAADRLRPTTV
ncbi:MAG: hypothetical protein HN740_05005 [Gammaproteobacteria bacterium]|jgi:hypothetical protein|nr:hypothetical protein [Gammaproteobacteria bacterium]